MACFKKYHFYTLVLIGLLAISCSNPQKNAQLVYVYTEQQDIGYDQAFQRFQIENDIQVVIKRLSFEEIVKQLQEKNGSDTIDLLIFNDISLMIKCEQLGFLHTAKREDINEHVPLKYRHPKNLWFGLGKHAKILVYNKINTDSSLLNTYQTLAAANWTKQIAQSSFRLSSNRSFLASILAHEGEENGAEWFKNFNKNFIRPAQGEEIEQINAIAQGIAKVAIVSSNSVGKYLKLKPEESSKIGVFFPNQSNYGTHINLSTAAIVKDAPNAVNAAKLIAFLSGRKGQEILTNQSFFYPIYSAVKPAPILESWGHFKEDNLDYNFLNVPVPF